MPRRKGGDDDPAGNPWGLTARQAQVMDAIVTHGCHKLAASALGISAKTTEAHVANAATRMPARTPLLRYLAWARWMDQRSKGRA